MEKATESLTQDNHSRQSLTTINQDNQSTLGKRNGRTETTDPRG